jgi:pimeloyl-ACP methyl ester carboxylesterase
MRRLFSWLLRRWKAILLGLAAAILLFVTVGVPYLLAMLITSAGTRPMDLELTSSPADYGLEFEEVLFPTSDGASISGWYLPGGTRGAVVALGHGLFRSRREVLDRAAFFRKQGYDALVFDFRRHGTSDGERVTLGYQERLDFEGAVAFLKSRRPEAPVVLYGVSMGAGAALLAARETPAVAAVIADSPFLNIEHTVVHHAKLIFGLPRFPFASGLLLFLEMRGGFDREDFDLEAAAKALEDRPLLVIAGSADERMPPELQKRVVAASDNPLSRFIVVEGAGHGAAYRVAAEAYESEVLAFLERAGL